MGFAAIHQTQTNAATVVFFFCYRLQVVRVYTASNAAQMIDLEPSLLAKEPLIKKPMSGVRPLLKPKSCVSGVVVRSFP